VQSVASGGGRGSEDAFPCILGHFCAASESLDNVKLIMSGRCGYIFWYLYRNTCLTARQAALPSSELSCKELRPADSLNNLNNSFWNHYTTEEPNIKQ
jgi:hypothetical protein